MPIWGYDDNSSKKDVIDYFADTSRAIDGFTTNNENDEGPGSYVDQLRHWGKRGWQGGMLINLRWEMFRRNMSEKPEIDLQGRRFSKRASMNDFKGDADFEAYQRTVALLTYEMEAAV